VSVLPSAPPSSPTALPLSESLGDAVPYVDRLARRPALLTPSARKGIRQRMLLLHQSALDRISALTGVSGPDLQRFRRELRESDLPDTLIQRGAGLAFTKELPQGALLYLLVRSLKPRVVVETGVRPGYSTAWILAALDAEGQGALTSLGPGPTAGRMTGVHDVTVGQFVPPALRSRWTLALGNTPDRLREILEARRVDLFFYDNGPDADRARFELKVGWEAMSPRGVVLAHHVDANQAWSDFCRWQGLPPQLLDAGPPPLGALGVRAAAPTNGGAH
jgi:predicted O-methyltransferase YrrM